jgi:hypothetical protein
MQVLVWLAIPFAAMLLAIVWVAWSNRPRKPQGMNESVAAFQRFRRAVAAATHQHQP